jgi:hypothetical protein
MLTSPGTYGQAQNGSDHDHGHDRGNGNVAVRTCPQMSISTSPPTIRQRGAGDVDPE